MMNEEQLEAFCLDWFRECGWNEAGKPATQNARRRL